MSFFERIAINYLNYLSMTAYLILAIIVLALGILFLESSEKKRFQSRQAKAKLKVLKMYDQNMSSDYDITSDKNIEHEEYETYRKESRWNIPLFFVSLIAMFMIMLSVLTAASLADTYINAFAHGYRAGLNTNAGGLWNSIHLSPKAENLPSDTNGKLIICYRFGCKDCEAVYNDLTEALDTFVEQEFESDSDFDSSDFVYWIATRTSEGKEFVVDHMIESVPTAVYIKNDGTDIIYSLYKMQNGESVLDTNALDELEKTIIQDRAISDT